MRAHVMARVGDPMRCSVRPGRAELPRRSVPRAGRAECTVRTMHRMHHATHVPHAPCDACTACTMRRMHRMHHATHAPHAPCGACTACTMRRMHRMHHAAHAPHAPCGACTACTMRRMHRVHPSTALPRTAHAPHRRRTLPCSGFAAAVLEPCERAIGCALYCRVSVVLCCASVQMCAQSRRAAPCKGPQGTCSASWSARTMYPCVSSLSFVSSFSACLASFAMCARLSSYSP